MIQGLNNKQKEAVLNTEGPLLILAGAGSGKTRVITNRIAYLIQDKHVDPKHILAITFTNKAAEEMRERVQQQVGMDAGGAWISTFHSCCVRILRMYSHLIGYDNNFSIYDADDQKTVVKNICKKLEIDTKRFKEKWFIGQISSAKDELISPEQFEMNAGSDYYLKKVASVYTEYQKELKKNNAFDFDDLICKTIELFKVEPEILERFQDRFRYISVDEYQDTNTAQFKLVSMLAKKYQNICVVGDDDQSIYKFRGANIGNILNFEKVFPDAKVIRLEQNYRSTKTILDAANAVISNNTQRKEKILWTENEQGTKIRWVFADNAAMEAERVVSIIKDFLKDGYNLNDCACLYRTNSQSRALEEAFIRANMPYKVVGGVNFYQRKEIKDALAYLKTIDNGKDDVSVRRIINTPKRNIGAASVNAIQSFANDRQINFYSALDMGVDEGVFGKAGEKLRSFRNLIEDLKAEAEEVSLKELVDDVLLKSGYLADLQAENTVESQTRIENIEELINKVVLYEDTAAEPTLGGFLEEVSLVADIDSWDSADDYVSLITVHSAKGLEFPNVFLCGMEDGLFPMSAAINSEDPTDLEEERRLAYVAITRAKKNLIISGARWRMIQGETMTSIKSRFVKEIPPLLIEEDRNNTFVPKRNEFETTRPSAGKDFFSAKPYAASADKKQFEVKNGGALDYAVGDMVHHMKFGDGCVLSIDQGGRDYEVTVDFGGEYGVKKMFASFAKLKKL
ncbi:MAG: DNA helicase PcrA [Lachnospiraceae bacterium]|nr:DNA helicase PcrA [Lachnospiraceae bacterium]